MQSLRIIYLAATAAAALAGCSRTDGGDSANDSAAEAAPAPPPPLVLSKLEIDGKAALDKKREVRRRADDLQAAVKKAMASQLFDPFSARFQDLRAGRKGAICGKYNAKNRYGAYVGFKDFVLSRDRETVFTSEHNDGIGTEIYGSFAEAYVNACASPAEAKRYAAATAPSDDSLMGEEPSDPFEGL